MVVTVRASRPDDGPMLQTIERLAGERFREIGLGAVADHDPFPVSLLADYAVAGRGWVAVDGSDRPIGYAVADIVDDQGHLEQVSVQPDHQGTGVGRTLIDRVADWARAAGCSTLTLTTFVDVPWNRPLYEHLGFRVLRDDEIGPGLRRVREAETAEGLDPTTRVCMVLDLEAPRPSC